MQNPFSYTNTKNKTGKFKVEISIWIFLIFTLSNFSGSSDTFLMIHPNSDIISVNYFFAFSIALLGIFRIWWILSSCFKEKKGTLPDKNLKDNNKKIEKYFKPELKLHELETKLKDLQYHNFQGLGIFTRNDFSYIINTSDKLDNQLISKLHKKYDFLTKYPIYVSFAFSQMLTDNEK